MWWTRRRRSSLATRSRRSRSSSANRSRTRRREVSTSIRSPVSGSTSASCPTSGSSASRGIADLDREHRVAHAAATRAVAPRRADHGSRRSPPTRPGWRASRRPLRARPPAPPDPAARRARRPPRAPAHRDHPRLGPARRQHRAALPAPNATSPTLPARRTPRRPNTSAAPSATSAFSRLRRAERHRGRDVEHDPGRERALGDVQADVRAAGAGARGRVDVAHVVAELVGPQLRELGAEADPGGAAVARKRARDQPVDGRGRAPRSAACASGPGPWRAAGGCSSRVGHALISPAGGGLGRALPHQPVGSGLRARRP